MSNEPLVQDWAPESNVRVRRDLEPEPAFTENTRSWAQQQMDATLDRAERLFREARDLAAEGLEVFGNVAVPQHPRLETLLSQQIEQVIEYRRMHR